ncbi:TRAP transporter large permease [Lacrimispora sp.]|uniref:TRAP transporter large permease n=1 Tax=Lacrimispora sp. TaxID=2719234 RepID=UPI0034600EA4
MLALFFVIFLIIGVPIGITTGMSTLICFQQNGIVTEVIARKMFAAVDSFSLMAIPFFIFSGDLMVQGGTSKRLINFANKCFGWITGGIPITTVISCMFFAALSGSSPATVAGIGSVMIPNMIDAKYSKKFTVGLICAAGSLGIIIPPSITMMTYGVVAELSVSDLFLAALIPGIFIGAVLIVVAVIYSRVKQFDKSQRPTIGEVGQAFKDSILSILMPVIVLGGIYSGMATPTEAASLAIVYSLVIGMFVYKEIKLSDLFKIAKKSVVTSSMIMFVIACSKAFSWYLTYEKIPSAIAEGILNFSQDRVVILLIINLLLLFVGMVMDSSAAVLILTPLLLPVVTNLGVNPVHFGVIMIVNLAIGMLTPPFGLNLFVASGISKLSLTDSIKGAIPFIFILIAALLVITFVPALSLALI